MATKNEERKPADYIKPLYMNGLSGRVMRMPAPAGKKREILFVYGHHSSLERWWGLAQDLNQYGAFTMPDLPGFGGMESFYKLGEKPTLDNLADYLAAFVKLHYSRKRVTIAGLSFGFLVATRMLQRHPDLVKRVDLFISVVGFSHHDDFTFTRSRMFFYRCATKLLSYRTPAIIFRTIALHPIAIRSLYARTHNAKNKFKGLEGDDLRKMLDIEVELWRNNDLRTHMFTNNFILYADNCRKQIDLPVWHVAVQADQYFDNHMVEQHMRVIFTDFTQAVSKLDRHTPSVIASIEMAAPLIPTKIRRVLAK